MIRLDKIELQVLRDLVVERLNDIEIERNETYEEKKYNSHLNITPGCKQEEFDLRMLYHKLENELIGQKDG